MTKQKYCFLSVTRYWLVMVCNVSCRGLANHDAAIPGPCVIKRTQLSRLQGIEVGHVQHMQLTSSGEGHVVRTLSLNPPIFEIPNFLSDEECARLIRVASGHVMQTSDIIHADTSIGNHDYYTSFGDWDRNGDKLIDKNEIYLYLLHLRDVHFTEKDIQTMLKKLKIGKIKLGRIHPHEFKGHKILQYIDKVRVKDTSVKGRHSNETWLDTWDDDVMISLNKRKAALTGLPMEVIEGSETPAVIKYGQGGHYHCHYDSHNQDNTQPCCDRTTLHNCRVCRYITIMYYLNDVTEGGQTAFPFANSQALHNKTWHRSMKNVSNLSAHCSKANLLVTPKRGKAVMWYNHVIEKQTGIVGGLDRASYHGGCDVIQGEKWIMNNWINV